MDTRQKAFDRFWKEWEEANRHKLELFDAVENRLSRRQLAEAAATAGWNAALDWAAKQIQGETK